MFITIPAQTQDYTGSGSRVTENLTKQGQLVWQVCSFGTHHHTKKEFLSQVIASRLGRGIDFYTNPSARRDNGQLEPLGQANLQLCWQESQADRRTNGV